MGLALGNPKLGWCVTLVSNIKSIKRNEKLNNFQINSAKSVSIKLLHEINPQFKIK